MILWSDDNGGTMPRKRYAKTFEIAFPTVFANKKMALIKPCSSSPSYRLSLSFRLVVRESTDQASPLIKNTPISTLWNHVSRIRSVSFSSPASMIDGWIHATDSNWFSSTNFRGCVVCVTASWYVDIVGMFSVFPTLARTSVVAKVIAVRGNKMAKIWRKLNLPFFDDISFLPPSFPIRFVREYHTGFDMCIESLIAMPIVIICPYSKCLIIFCRRKKKTEFLVVRCAQCVEFFSDTGRRVVGRFAAESFDSREATAIT